MQMNYSFASDLPFKNFCKLSKTGFVTISIVWQTHKLTSYRSKQFSYKLFSTEQTQTFTRITSRRADFIHSQREIKEIFDPKKHTFAIKPEEKSPSLVLLLCLIPCHRYEKCGNRISRLTI